MIINTYLRDYTFEICHDWSFEKWYCYYGNTTEDTKIYCETLYFRVPFIFASFAFASLTRI